MPLPDAWEEIFDDAVAVEAMVDRRLHIITLKRDTYRLKDEYNELATTNATHKTAKDSTVGDYLAIGVSRR